MKNPAPRPALRRAPDAAVHPALGAGTVNTIDLRSPQRDRTADVATSPSPGLSPKESKDAKAAKRGKKARPATSATKTKPGKKAKRGKKAHRIDMHLRIPADVRHQLRSTAKARGTSVDEVVTSVLEGWRLD